MARDERDRKTDEDLFEDLDQFFAPLDETDWPEEAGTPVAGSEPPPAPEARGERPPPPERPAGEQAADADIEDLEELEIDLPEPEPGIPEAPAAEEPAPAPPEESPAAAAPPPRDEEWDREQEEDWIASATADIAGEDWELGDAAAAGPAAVPPPGGAEAPAEPGGDRPLSVEDLQTPPPQYANLPGPAEEEEPVLAEEATMEDLEAPLAVEDEGLPEEVAPVAEAEVREEVSAPPPPPKPELPPEEGEIEAAAQHFASGLGEPGDVQREILSDLEPDTRTAPIDREAVMERAAADRPDEAELEGAEAAPAWESEGTHAAVTTEVEEGAPPPTERNLVAAMVTGILLAAAVIALLAIGKGPFAVLAGAVILLGQGELYAVMRRRGYHPATLLGLVAGGFIVAGAYIKGPAAILLGLSLAMLLAVLWYMVAPPNARKGTLRDAAVTIFGIVYVPFLASFALLLLAATGDDGRNIFLAVVGLTILYDVCAYAIGSLWGNRPLAPSISPRKSWEGAIGATFVLLLAALAIVPSIDPFTAASAVGLALVIAVTAPLGDLVESALKRDVGVKDMSGLLPGHGGILDRIDALLFTCPAAYWFLLIAL